MGRQNTRIAEIIFKKNKVEEVSLPDFKTYCTATVINTRCFWQKYRQHRQMEQNREPKTDFLNNQ